MVELSTPEPDAVVVLAGGDPVDPAIADDLPSPAFVVAADSGLHQADRLGLEVDLIVGDLDSVSAAALARVEGIPIEQHPIDKSHTDLELALDAARRLDVGRLVVVGGDGGRLDHLLVNAAVLRNPRLAHMRIEWFAGQAHTYVVRSEQTLHGAPGDLVSLLAVDGPATGVRTLGLRWELTGATLEPTSGQGLSNVFEKPVARVSVELGVLLVILPAGGS
jgi:thiamine pyrophosphokinase